MSAAVASPVSLGTWSASQRKAASRIFAQALFSALPNAASRDKVAVNSWKSVEETSGPDTVQLISNEPSRESDEYSDSCSESCDDFSYSEVRIKCEVALNINSMRMK